MSLFADDASRSTAASREIGALVEENEANASIVERRLGEDANGASSVLLAGLDWDSVQHIYMDRKIVSDHDSTLGRSERTSLTNLIEILTAFASEQARGVLLRRPLP